MPGVRELTARIDIVIYDLYPAEEFCRIFKLFLMKGTSKFLLLAMSGPYEIRASELPG
jgi:hypothetical protein